MACTCGKPDCIQCLIERTSQVPSPPSLTPPTLDAIILVIRPIQTTDPLKQSDRNQAMTSILHHLQSLTLLCNDLNLSASLNTKHLKS